VIAVPRERRTAGFTLLELLIVLTVAGLLVSLTAPLYSSVVPGMRAKAQSRELIVTLRRTASAAISSGRTQHIRFRTEPASYAADGSRTVVLADGTQLAIDTGPDPTRRAAAFEDSDGVVSMSFFPDGSSTGGTIRLSRTAEEYFIGVDWLTGRVEVIEHADAR